MSRFAYVLSSFLLLAGLAGCRPAESPSPEPETTAEPATPETDEATGVIHTEDFESGTLDAASVGTDEPAEGEAAESTEPDTTQE